jgi:phage-related protein
MKHAAVTRDAVRFNLQVVHAASVQKRGILLNFINGTISLIQQQIQAGISQAQSTFQQVQSQITSVIANVTTGLQTTATRIQTQISNFPRCANEQTANVARIVNQTGMLLYQLY